MGSLGGNLNGKYTSHDEKKITEDVVLVKYSYFTKVTSPDLQRIDFFSHRGVRLESDLRKMVLPRVDFLKTRIPQYSVVYLLGQ